MHIRFSLSLGLGLVVAAPHCAAQLSTVHFDNVASVPSGHLPMTGGLLHPTSQNFQEEGLHVESFWVPNNARTFVHGHFHHVENGYEGTHGFATAAGLGPDRQGLYIRRQDGAAFDLLGHRYRNRHGAATVMYITGSLDPAVPGFGQFTAVPVGRGTLWQAAEVTQFQDITELFMTSDLGTSSSQHFYWDDIRTGVASDLVVDPIEGSALAGGTGWLSDSWETTGLVGVGVPTTSGAPRRVVRIKNTGSISRVATLAGALNPRLSVDVMIANYEGADKATLQVSGDGINFTTLREFTEADSDGEFYEYRFDLSFLGALQFLDVALVTETTGTPDYCFMDNFLIRGVDSGGDAPVADAGADRVVVDPTASGAVDVVLDGSASFDPDGTIVSYEWTEGQISLGSGSVLAVSLAYGDHLLTLTVEDDTGSVSTDDVRVYSSPGSLASDGFESGNLLGGIGDWSGTWDSTGLVSVGAIASRSGSISRIRDMGSVTRVVDLDQASYARLSFWYMVADYELSDEALIEVSPDGVSFTTIHALTSADSDRVWHFLDLDLSAFAMTSNFVVRLRADTQITNARDYIHIDDIEVSGSKL